MQEKGFRKPQSQRTNRRRADGGADEAQGGKAKGRNMAPPTIAHTGTRITQTNLTTIQTHQHTRTTSRRPNPRPAQQPQPRRRSRTLPAADSEEAASSEPVKRHRDRYSTVWVRRSCCCSTQRAFIADPCCAVSSTQRAITLRTPKHREPRCNGGPCARVTGTALTPPQIRDRS